MFPGTPRWCAVLTLTLLGLPVLAAEPPRLDADGDPLPAGAVVRLGTGRFRTHADIRSLAFSPDGKSLAATDLNGTVYLWDSGTGKERLRLDGTRRLLGVAFSPCGTCLAALRETGDGVLWDLAKGDRRSRFGKVKSPLVIEVAPRFTPDGSPLHFLSPSTLLLRVGRELTVAAADGSEHRPLLDLGETFHCATMAVSPDRKWLALLAHGAGHLRGYLVDLTTPPAARPLVLGGKHARVSCLAFAPEGRSMAAGCEGAAVVFDAAGREVARLEGGRPEVTHLAFTGDGKRLLVRTGDEKLRVWEPASGKVVRTFAAPALYLAFSPDGTKVALALNRSVSVLDVTTGEAVPGGVAGHEDAIQALAFSRDGGRLAVGGEEDPGVYLWDLPRARRLARLPVRAELLAFSPDGGRLATASRFVDVEPSHRPARVWDLSTGREALKLTPHSEEGFPLALAFAPDGRSVLLAAVDRPGDPEKGGRVSLARHDADTGRAVRRDTDRAPTPERASLSADGRLLACSGGHLARGRDDGGDTVRLYDVERGRVVRSIPRAGPGTPDTYTPRGLALVWHPARGCITRTALSPDGSLVLCGSKGGWLSVFEVATGRPLWRTGLFGRDVTAVAFSPDGRHVAAADSRPPLPLHTDPAEPLLWLADAWAERFPIAPDTEARHSVRVWELPEGKEVTRFEGHRSAAASLAFRGDGKVLASGLNDTTVLVWDVAGSVKARRRAAPLAPEVVERLWREMAGAEVPRAYRAMRTLADRPDEAVPLLRRHLRPASLDVARVRRLVGALDSDDFEKRGAALRDLKELPEEAEPEVRRALGETQSEEVRRRLTTLLATWPLPPSPEELRGRRAVQVLEWIGSDEARALLAALAEGVPDARQTRSARGALGRLGGRAPR
jgi:WD40 repeat protein